MAELLGQEVQWHPGPGETHGCRMPVIVDDVPGDADLLADSLVLVINRVVRSCETSIGAGESSSFDLLSQSLCDSSGDKDGPQSRLGLGVLDQGSRLIVAKPEIADTERGRRLRRTGAPSR